jgi:hypothetical protein
LDRFREPLLDGPEAPWFSREVGSSIRPQGWHYCGGIGIAVIWNLTNQFVFNDILIKLGSHLFSATSLEIPEATFFLHVFSITSTEILSFCEFPVFPIFLLVKRIGFQ